MNNITFYRATTSDKENFTNYGDTIAVRAAYDTDVVYNLTTGKNYTYGGEQGTKITNNDFPLTATEKKNLEAYNLGFNWATL